MSPPFVTIAIPTYNRGTTYLPLVMAGALGQDYPHLEILVSDNASPDSTPDVMAAISDRRVRYFRHDTNIGANDNFTFCLEQARGEYFLLLHDDDLIDSDFVRVCIESAADRGPVGLIRTGMRRIDADGRVTKEVPNLAAGLSTAEFFEAWFEARTPMHLCCSLLNTERLREIGGFRSGRALFQDVIAEVQLAARYGRVDVQGIHASFRTHEHKYTFLRSVQHWCDDSSELLELMCALVPGDERRIRRLGHRFLIRHNMNLVRQISARRERLQGYWVVCRHFNYPVSYVLSRLVSRWRIAHLGRGIRRRIGLFNKQVAG